jgi:hypothetical protein
MRQIIALGGGGFSTEPENPLLDLYILHQSGKSNPKICYVPTANGDSDICIKWFYDFFKQQQCQPSHLSLFKPPTRDLEGFILDKDINLCWWREYKESVDFMEGMGTGCNHENGMGTRDTISWCQCRLYLLV